MVEKQYRLNKWGTKLLKNNRPLFDWANESNNIVDLLNEQNKRIKELEKENVKLRNDIFEKHWKNYTDHEGYTGETTDDIRFSTEEDKIFEERIRKALERVEKSDRKPLSSKEFLEELKNW